MVDREGLLLKTLSEDMALTDMNALHEYSTELNVHAQSLCQGDNGQQLKDMRVSWSKAMVHYHRLKVLLFRPVNILDEVNPLSTIYTPYPAVKSANRTIKRQIKRASKLKSNYSFPPSPPSPSARGLSGLENMLFNLFESRASLVPGSGECIFLTYTTETLLYEVTSLKDHWMETFFGPLQSPNGQTDAYKTNKEFAKHLTRFVEERVLQQAFAIPLGEFEDTERFPCEKDKNCHTRYLEHPFYPNRHIAYTAPLEVIYSLFALAQDNSLASSVYNFQDYIDSKKQDHQKGQKSQENLLKLMGLTVNLKNIRIESEFNPQNEQKVVVEMLDQLHMFVDWMKSDFLFEMSTVPIPAQGDSD